MTAGDRQEKSAVREAVIRFGVFSVIALLILILATLLWGSRIARQEALRDARYRGASIGNLIAAPLVNAAIRAHKPGASNELTTVMQNRMGDGSVIHVRLWDKDGDAIWADQKMLVNKRSPMSEDMKAVFGTQNVTAEVTDLRDSHDVSERKLGEVIEVYVGVRDIDGSPMLFEAYFSSDRMHKDEQAIIKGFMPIAVAALLLYQLAVLPLAVTLARRVERGLAERSSWMRHALLASDLERRRIAQDLHDGVIQDLAGLSYVMPTLHTQFAGDSAASEAARETSQRVSQILSRDVAALRTMITDIYPPNLQGPGFVVAIQDLARAAGERGVEVHVDIPPQLKLPVDAARLAYRVVREGLRNVTKHAQASAATVQVRQESERIVVAVSDNGRGVQDQAPAEGHLGLRLLEDTVRDLGGRFDLRSSPAGGAVLEASFPVKLVQP
ncbi:MAG: hypothetical protein QOE58_2192 [Actinomycetota bacterium]|nr:hypothetical protein [Actinomycetota bacterium]